MLRGRISRAALPGLQVRQSTAAQALASRAHLEASLSTALALQSPAEYRRWLLAYARFLAEQGDAARLGEVCAALLGGGSAAAADGDAEMADAEGGEAGGSGEAAGTWQPTVLGLSKHELLGEVLTEMGRNRHLQRTTQPFLDALSEIKRAAERAAEAAAAPAAEPAASPAGAPAAAAPAPPAAAVPAAATPHVAAAPAAGAPGAPPAVAVAPVPAPPAAPGPSAPTPQLAAVPAAPAPAAATPPAASVAAYIAAQPPEAQLSALAAMHQLHQTGLPPETILATLQQMQQAGLPASPQALLVALQAARGNAGGTR